MKQVRPEDIQLGKVYQINYLQPHGDIVVKVFTALEEPQQVPHYPGLYFFGYFVNNIKTYYKFEVGYNTIWELE
jgi:hypothetical protein